MANRTLIGVSGRTGTATVRPPAGRKAAAADAKATSAADVTADERRQRIAEAAYFMAEQRGFAPGCELDDWLQAEAEIDFRIRAARH